MIDMPFLPLISGGGGEAWQSIAGAFSYRNVIVYAHMDLQRYNLITVTGDLPLQSSYPSSLCLVS